MSVPGRQSQSLRTMEAFDRRHWVGLAIAATFVVAALTGLVIGPVGGTPTDATGANNTTDTESPWLASGTPINDTAVRLVVADDVGVNEDSINVSDFIHEEGFPQAVNVTENGSNATVRLHIGGQVQENELSITITPDGSILDDAGRELTASSDRNTVIVSGMDSLPPEIGEFTAEHTTSGVVNLSIQSSEQLAEFDVSVGGADDAHLTEDAFTTSEDPLTYNATYRTDEHGTITFTLTNVSDEYGNAKSPGATAEVFADTKPPDTVAEISFDLSGERTLTFDARATTDDSDIVNYTWKFGDGSDATGQRVTHTYEPGSYVVELAATDEYGNVGTDRIELNLSAENTTNETAEGPVVSIDTGQSVESAFVGIERAVGGESLAVSREEGPLVLGDGFALDALSVTFVEAGNASLGVSSAGAASVRGAANATDTRSVGGIEVISSRSEDDIDGVTFEFSVETDRLDELDATPSNVSLLRGTEGEWSRLQTTTGEVENGTAHYTANAPGFSVFAIVADPQEPEPTETPTPTPTPEPTTATPTPTATATPTPNTTATPTTTSEGPTPTPGESRQFSVTNVTLNPATVSPGEVVTINATVENRGNSSGRYTTGLVVDSTVVETTSVTPSPGESTVAQFTYSTNETGTYAVAVNGTLADQELTVGESEGDGSLFGIFGFLPLGLLGTLLKFVVLPLAVVFLALKGVAYYLGY